MVTFQEPGITYLSYYTETKFLTTLVPKEIPPVTLPGKFAEDREV